MNIIPSLALIHLILSRCAESGYGFYDQLGERCVLMEKEVAALSCQGFFFFFFVNIEKKKEQCGFPRSGGGVIQYAV